MKRLITFHLPRITAVLLAFVIGLSSCNDDDGNRVGERLEQSMGLYTTSASLVLGDTVTLAPKFAEGITPKRTYEWTAENPEILSMEMKENYAVLVTALSEGSTTLTVASTDGALQRSLPVSIYDGADGVYINFGVGTNASFTDGWNLLSDVMEGASISNLKTSAGFETGISLTVVQRFNQNGNAGASDTDTELVMPSAVSKGYFLGNSWNNFQEVITEQSQLYLEGLDPDQRYDFYIFGSRDAYTDNRTGTYAVVGLNNEAKDLNGSGNNSELAVIRGIQPRENGTINVIVRAAEDNSSNQGFFYLNAMRFAVAEDVE